MNKIGEIRTTFETYGKRIFFGLILTNKTYCACSKSCLMYFRRNSIPFCKMGWHNAKESNSDNILIPGSSCPCNDMFMSIPAEIKDGNLILTIPIEE